MVIHFIFFDSLLPCKSVLHISFHIAGIKYEIGKKYVRGFHNEREEGDENRLCSARGRRTYKGFAIKFKVLHPPLTDEGRNQAKLLQCNVPLQEADILIASPTLRTLQTATIWSAKVACQKIVHPYVSPRIFPYREEARTLPCDYIVDQGMITKLFPHFR